jgi:hypothetical protein
MAVQLVEVGVCVVHGLVQTTRITLVVNPEINTGACCTACYIEFIREHVNKVQNPHMIEVEVRAS